MNKISRTGAAIDHAKQPYAVMVWRGGYDNVTRLDFADPLEALLTGITYLRRKYSVRLTDAACDALEELGPELERLLPADADGIKQARATELRKRAPAKPRAVVGGVVPVVFSAPPLDALPLVLD